MPDVVKMNPVVKELWLNELENSDRVQGRHRLHTVMDGVEKFCCLGVLCDLAFQAGVVTRWLVTRFGIPRYLYAGDSVTLPPEVITWAGLHDYDPYVIVGVNYERSLCGVNDDDGYSFREIAEFIRQSL